MTVLASRVTVQVSGGGVAVVVRSAAVVIARKRPGILILRRATFEGPDHDVTKIAVCVSLAVSRVTRVTVAQLLDSVFTVPQMPEPRHICNEHLSASARCCADV